MNPAPYDVPERDPNPPLRPCGICGGDPSECPCPEPCEFCGDGPCPNGCADQEDDDE